MRLAGLSGFCLLFACSEPATQLVVIVDTDYRVPEELAFIRAIVRDAEGAQVSELERELVAPGAGAGVSMPCSFAVVPQDGDASRRVIVEIEGYAARGGRKLIVRRAVTGFVAKKSLSLPMFLARACEPLWSTCDAGETCTERGCESESRPPGSLDEFDPRDEDGLPKPDAGFSDAGGQDDRDAEIVDAPETFDDATLDAGQDAGLGDALSTDAECETIPAAPALLNAGVTLSHEIEYALVAGDIDVNGTSEVIASRGGAGTSAVSVVALDACLTPSIETITANDLIHEPIWVPGAAIGTLWLAERTSVVALRYRPTITPALTLGAAAITGDDVFSIAGAVGYDAVIAVLRRGATRGLAVIELNAGTPAFVGTNDPFRGRAAHITRDYFAGTGASALYIVEEDSPQEELTPLTNAADPVVATLDAGSRIYAVFTRSDRRLSVVRVGVDKMLTTTATATSFASAIVHEPVLARSATGDLTAYVLLANGTLTSCVLRETPSFECTPTDLSDTFPVPEGSAGPITLVTAYVNNDAQPDVVLVTGAGTVHFRDGARLADAAAPSVQLQATPTAAGAILGELLAIPHAAGQIAWVGWRRPANAGPATKLWTQYRGDAVRSARILE